MDRRGEPRIKKRIACELCVGEKRFNGLVLDFSSHGLFVQTAAQPDPGERVRVALSASGRPAPLVVEAVVARTKLVPPQLRTVAQGGLGLHVPQPTAEFAQFVEDVQRPVKIQKVSILPGSAPAPAQAKTLTKERLDRFFAGRARAPKPQPGDERPVAGPYTRLPRWRIRLRHDGGEGTRSFIVRSESEADAREQVLAELDDGWKIEAIQRI